MTPQKREGRTIGQDPEKLRKRRLADGRNAFRKMDAEQRQTFLSWIQDEFPKDLRTFLRSAGTR